jgi:mono/diheme cytochrome c family protein
LENVYKGFALVGLILAALMIVVFVREYTPVWKGEQEVYHKPWRQGLYEENCASCHGKDGQGRVASGAPAIGNPDFLQNADEEFIFNMVKYGRPGTNMMAYGRQDGGVLSDDLIREIVAYVRTMRPGDGEQTKSEKPGTGKPEQIIGSVGKGKDLFKANCAVCHGVNAQGKAGPNLINPIFQQEASDRFIKTTISKGRQGTPMGAYGDGRNSVKELTDQEINDLVVYIRSLNVEGR